ncbi:MAG: hypothetical protein LC745_07190, partial [Planctomycetia bacterium]|nr:hypothetical protein [Planctomycetia bacterium]
YPTLTGAGITLPITSVDPTTNTIVFGSPLAFTLGFIPGFTDGQAVVYHAVAGKDIGGLTDGTTYYAIVNPADPGALLLSATPPSRGVDGPAVPLNLAPVFQGFDQSLPVTINPPNRPANSLQFNFNAGFQLGDHFVYQGSGIAGLVDGVTYYAIPDPNDPTTIQLAASLAQAQAGTAVAISGLNAPGTLAFEPTVSIDATANTVDLGFNYASAPSQPLSNGASVVYHGVLGLDVLGLTDGTTYYVIQDSANPRIMRLTTAGSAAAGAAYQAGQSAFTADDQAAYNQAIAGGQTPQQATAAASQAATSFGATWTAAGINDARLGNPPPVGSFPVTVNSAASTASFGFDPGLTLNHPLVYEGPSGSNPGIVGLVVGQVYYVLIPQGQENTGVIQLAATPSGKPIALSLPQGTATTILLGDPTNSPVTVSSSANTITFGDPTNPFDPGLTAGDPFVYQGPMSTGDAGITGLNTGSTYYVILTSTPGVIQLAATPQLAQQNTALPIRVSNSGTTTINYAIPYTPTDTRPLIVTQLKGIDTSTLSGLDQKLTPADAAGLTISATLVDSESDYSTSGITSEPPGWEDKLMKPEVGASTISSWFSKTSNQAPDGNNENNSVANSPPEDVVANQVPGSNGTSPSFALTGAFGVNYASAKVKATVAATAVLESRSDINISASNTLYTNTEVTSSLERGDQSGGEATALAFMFAYYAPKVDATIADDAQVDAAGTVAVTATTTDPFAVPMSGQDVAQDIAFYQANSSFNPVNFVASLLTDGMLGLGADFLNNTANATAEPEAKNSKGIGGNLQIFVYVNDTKAKIGKALINQKTSDPNALGPGLGFQFRNAGQSVAVDATTTYQNAAEAGGFNLNLSARDLYQAYTGTAEEPGSLKKAGGAALNLFGDSKGGTAIGGSIYVDALDNTTVAEIETGAMIGVGASGTLEVEAGQQITAVSLVQSGGAGGNIGVSGSVDWYNLVSTTRAQIEDGVTVNNGDPINPTPGGGVNVHADDDMIIVGVTGGAVTSNHIGVGFSISVNNIKRTVLALIGSTKTPSKKGAYQVASLHVAATTEGDIGTVAYAAAVVAPAPPAGANPAVADVPDPPGLDNLAPLAEPNGIAVSGDASVNVIQDRTEAYVNDPGTVVTQG